MSSGSKFCANLGYVISLLLIVLQSYCIAIQWKEQDQYVVELRRADVENFDKATFKDVYFKSFKINRRQFAFNVSFTLLVPLEKNTCIVNIQGFKNVGQQYSLKLVDFNLGICELVNNAFFGVAVLHEGNKMLPECPVKPGHFHGYNQQFNGSSFPPNIPSGSYKLHVTFWRNRVNIISVNMYMELIYKNKKIN